MSNTNRTRQAELRLRRYKAGLVELRGIWATPAQAEVIRELAKAVTCNETVKPVTPGVTRNG